MKLIVKFIIVIAICLISYAVGFGQGQSSTYSKFTDDKSIEDIYKK